MSEVRDIKSEKQNQKTQASGFRKEQKDKMRKEKKNIK